MKLNWFLGSKFNWDLIEQIKRLGAEIEKRLMS
jgi:hypothetical protein